MAAANNKEKFKGAERETESAVKSLDVLVETSYNPQEHKDKTRSEIALYFVKSYIMLVIFIFVIVFVYNLFLLVLNRDSLILEIKDIFPLVLGTVGTLLGFVLGYYFKSEEGK